MVHGVAMVDAFVSAAVQAIRESRSTTTNCGSGQSRPWQIRTVDRAFRN
jgi:hypothetical protein